MATLNDIETKIESIIAILKSRIVKTITGILPLTFTTQTAGAASDWEIEGNNNIGKNLLNIESATMSEHATIVSVDNSTGSIVATADIGYSYRSADIILTDILEVGKTYTITLIKNNVTPAEQKANCAIRRADTNTIVASVGSEKFEAAGAKSINYTHTQERAEEGVYFSLMVVGNSSAGGTVSVSNLMLREQDTSADFDPYQVGVGEKIENGYQIPLTISQQGQTDKNYDIYIGLTPLTAGQSVSKNSTGVDLELFEGENTVSTTLYNKPEMTIKYKYNGGN